WADTCATLHLWTQIVGKIRLALTPAVNHWWNVPLYVTSRGLTTSLMFHGARGFHPAVRRGPRRAVARRCGDAVPAKHIRSGGWSGRLGPLRAGANDRFSLRVIRAILPATHTEGVQ